MPDITRLRRRLRSLAWRRWHAAALAVLLGVLAATGQVPLALWPLSLAGFTGALLLHRAAPWPRAAAWRGWAFGVGYFTACLFWIVEPFRVDASATLWMAPFALVFLTGGLALFWVAACWLAARLQLGSLGWVAAMLGGEMLRARLFSGFPWALPGYIWSETPVAQLAAAGGPWLLTLLTLGAAAGAARTIRAARAWPAIAAALAVAGAWAYGAARLQQPAPIETDHIVRLVQPNAPQHMKWDPAHAPGWYQRQIDYTKAAPLGDGQPRPGLIVWPETAIATWMQTGVPNGYVEEMAEAAQGARIVFGINREAGLRAYNSAFVIGPDGTVADVYDKHLLVPFGEYIPAGWLIGPLGFRAFTQEAGYGFSPGPGPALLDLGPAGVALPLICYEAIFPRALRAGARPDFLLHLTNDAWFGTLAGPQQHFAQARMRAIEQGLPMIRVANTGISGVIGARGTVRTMLPLGTAGWVDAAIPGALPATPYARWGDMPALILLAGLALIAWLTRRRPGIRERV